MNDAAGGVPPISPSDLASEPATVILDVRRKPDDAQIPGSRTFSSDALLADPRLPDDIPRDAKVVVYCGTGNTCRSVAAALQERGYDARPLEGGYRAWRDAGLPVEPRR